MTKISKLADGKERDSRICFVVDIVVRLHVNI